MRLDLGRTQHLNLREPDASKFAWVRALPAGPADNDELAWLVDADGGDSAELLRGDDPGERLKHMGLRPADALGDPKR
jgi:hypothetical protein